MRKLVLFAVLWLGTYVTPSYAAETPSQIIADKNAQIAALRKQVAYRDGVITVLQAKIKSMTPDDPPADIARMVEDYNTDLRRAAFDDADAAQAIATMNTYHAYPWKPDKPISPNVGLKNDIDEGEFRGYMTALSRRVRDDLADEDSNLHAASRLYSGYPDPRGGIINTGGYVRYYIETLPFVPSEQYEMYLAMSPYQWTGAPKLLTGLRYIERRGVNGPTEALHESP